MSFFGLGVSVRGLYTAQRSLDVVNHNINNVNTPGYSRQQVVQTAGNPLPTRDGTGMIGTGSEINAVKRVRDEYIDCKYWEENIAKGEWNVKSELLSEVETTFNEPSDSGFNEVIGDFYSSLQELAKNPSSTATRSLVKEKGVMVAKYFNSIAEHFNKLQEDINDRIKSGVAEVNTLAEQIRQLNNQIYSAEIDGSTANDLRDQRTVIVDKLSKIINIQAGEVVTGKLPDGRDNKHFIVTVSGKALVDHFDATKMKPVTRESGKKLNSEDIDNLCEIQWEDSNMNVNIKGGELKGYMDIRDGNEGDPAAASYPTAGAASPLYKGIPYYQKKLNQFVRTYARAFNEGFINNSGGGYTDLSGHADGYELNSAVGDTTPSGIRFFTMLKPDDTAMDSTEFLAVAGATVYDKYDNITAQNFAVSEDILSNINLISASDTGGQNGNINNLNAILTLRQNKQMFTEGAPEDYMQSLVSTLGVDSQLAKTISNNQDTILKQVDNRRLSDSGVSLDEEMSNLVKFQHAYNASAKMISTMAEIYDTLINRTGV